MHERPFWQTSRRFKTGAVLFSLLGIGAVIADGQSRQSTDNTGHVKDAPRCTGVVFTQPHGYIDGSLIYVFPLIDGRVAQVHNVHGKVVAGVSTGEAILPTKFENHGDVGYVWDLGTTAAQHSRVKVEGTLAGKPFSCPVQELTYNPGTNQIAPLGPEQNE